MALKIDRSKHEQIILRHVTTGQTLCRIIVDRKTQITLIAHQEVEIIRGEQIFKEAERISRL